MNHASLLQVNDLSHSLTTGRESITILNGVNFTIDHAQSVAIIGESGSGKSTLLSLLAGLDQADSGEIIIDGENICQMNEDGRAQFRAQTMGFVFQSFQLMPTYTALENVMLPLELQGKGQDISQRAEALLTRVGLQERLSHYPHQLSGGEQQRVALARAFVGAPRILFADEPTGNLDPKTSEVIADLMFELNSERQTTLVLVTHEKSLAKRCVRRLQLRNGQIEEA